MRIEKFNLWIRDIQRAAIEKLLLRCACRDLKLYVKSSSQLGAIDA